ncbi:hypothetical protein SAMN04487944_1282 [Gracilibacillus ureilyticus]|uniref:Uncharacterized protein n=1 Tax=Gracilibacillus ureilyticus TaxID=531814 RepID=A0A1H9VUJ8_9BACI|nr:hypothetical protein [Gracilibacillus ureilyticus]SES25209.1 hypothetical protein SAMN04487944_1282 [Gracilibacillus ureilyticus]
MKENWKIRRKLKSRKSKKHKDDYTAWDVIVDVLLWVPELLIFPFRMLFWFLRIIGKFLGELLDAF